MRQERTMSLEKWRLSPLPSSIQPHSQLHLHQHSHSLTNSPKERPRSGTQWTSARLSYHNQHRAPGDICSRCSRTAHKHARSPGHRQLTTLHQLAAGIPVPFPCRSVQLGSSCVVWIRTSILGPEVLDRVMARLSCCGQRTSTNDTAIPEPY